jgi:hypothetical protein
VTRPFSRTLAAVTVAALMLVGCARAAQPTEAPAARPSTPSSRGPVTRETHLSSATQNPDAAAVAAARALASSDTVLDAYPNDTIRRSSAWLTADFAASVTGFPPVAAPGSIWASWTAHHAYLRVRAMVASDEHPTDTATTAARQVVESVIPIGRDGWRGTPFTQVAFLTLALVRGVWEISSYQVSAA